MFLQSVFAQEASIAYFCFQAFLSVFHSSLTVYQLLEDRRVLQSQLIALGCKDLLLCPPRSEKRFVQLLKSRTEKVDCLKIKKRGWGNISVTLTTNKGAFALLTTLHISWCLYPSLSPPPPPLSHNLSLLRLSLSLLISFLSSSLFCSLSPLPSSLSPSLHLLSFSPASLSLSLFSLRLSL